MRYLETAVTDVGTNKRTNQDSVCIKAADTKKHGQVLMAVICDGMGGLSKGELASATVIKEFDKWFSTKLPKKMNNLNFDDIGAEWDFMLKNENQRILDYGKKIGTNLGTTFTGMFIADDKYVIVHVGDTRIYKIKENVEQLTEDHTYVAREIRRGNMTLEQALVHPKRNMLLQCIGASREVCPDIIYGDIYSDTVYMLCSDGFRHMINNREIYEKLNPAAVISEEQMNYNAKQLVDTVKSRNEKDNITVALIRTK